MNTSHTPLPYEEEPDPREPKPHRLVVRSVQAWGLFCAAMFLLALFIQWSRIESSSKPIRWREIVAWVCFDALFFLGAYAAFRMLGGRGGADDSDGEQDD